MAGSTFGTHFKITTWGESHGKALGVVIDGCPAGLPLFEEDIQPYLDRRKPGQTALSTPRKEADQAEILSGVFEGKTTGTPISLKSPPITAPAMRTTPLTQNTVSGITEAAAVPPGAKPPDVWRQAP